MQHEDESPSHILVYSLGLHPYLGYLLEPHAVMLNANGSLSMTHKRLFSNTVEDYNLRLDDRDLRVIRLLEEVEQNNIIKKYVKKNIRAADFFAQHLDQKLYDFIRPAIERRLLEALELLPGRPLYLMGKSGYPAEQELSIASESASVLFHFRRNDIETRYFPTIKYAGARIEFMYRDAQVIINEQAWLLLDQVLYHFDQPLEGKKLTPFLQKRYIAVPRETERRYFDTFVTSLIEKHHVYAEGFEIQTHQHNGTAIVQLKHLDNSSVIIHLQFQYGPYRFEAGSDHKVTVRMVHHQDTDTYTFHRIRRSLQWENNRMQELLDLGLEKDGIFGGLTIVSNPADSSLAILDWLRTNYQQLRDRGFEIIQEQGNKRFFIGVTSLEISVADNNDWFDVNATARFGNNEIPFVRLRSHILNHTREFTLPNGEIAVIPEEWFARYTDLFHFSDTRTAIKIKKHHVGLLEDISEHKQLAISRKLDNLAQFDGIMDVALPQSFRGTLRAYQQAGYNWFYFLQQYGFGGCLADDMGLGKTIQTLALLQNEKDRTTDSCTSLIVMPTSLIYNWEKEAAKFVPELRILVHTGSNRIRDAAVFASYDVVITTYGILRSDHELMASFYFHYIILDESQNIKNPTSKSFKAVKGIKGKHRLLLSGTPVENTVGDLWSQMSFANPGLLGSYPFFQKEFVLPIERKKDEQKASKLQAIIKPFVLRRTKSQVVTELPPKSEQVFYCEMGEEQAEEYDKVKSEYRNLIFEYETGSAVKSPQITLLQGLTKLRLLANHPKMVEAEFKGESGKFKSVVNTLDSVMQRGNKVLIFSQFVGQLQLYRQYLESREIKYAYLDGATRNRGDVVSQFREDDDTRLFLISIKAGGVGLNLVEADYVFILDPWWNPAVEQQAIDRTHRIGQTRNVFIYKFITKDTVEEKILALQERKKSIASALITTEESFVKALTQEDIRELLT